MKKSFLFILGLTALFTGCTQENSGKNERGVIELSPVEKSISKQSNDFAFGLLNAASKNLADKQQIVVSPLSASMALSMAMNGATEETLEEMMEVLGFEGATIDEVNAFNKKLMTGLTQLDKTAKLSFANSLWLNNVTPQETYKETITNNYNAEIFTRDFAKRGTLDAINGWCSKATNGKIGRMYDELPAGLQFLLLDATYFKAEWATPFTKITDGKFTKENGEEQTVKFMNGEHEARYYDSEKFKAYGIQYGNEAFSYYIVMPEEEVTIDECAEELANGAWNEATAMGNSIYKGYVDLDLTMPMYETKFNADIIPALKSMGMKKAFSKEIATFNKILEDKSLFISKVTQATTFKVDELGAEASAVTSVGGYETDVNPFGKITLVVDRPFIFFVKEQSTETILFAGKMGEI